MTKYNVGDVLEITESFFLEGAQYEAGQKYTVEGIFNEGELYELEDKETGHTFNNTVSVDAHSGFRKVEPKVEFKVGDKVRLLEGAHGNPELAFSWSTEGGFEKNFGYHYDLAEPFVVHVEIDYAGEVGISQGGWNSYVLSEFLVPWVEAEPELKEPFLQHMVLGKTYKHSQSHLYYRADALDSGNSLVYFTFGDEPDVGQNLTSNRRLVDIEEEFGVLPPVKPENEYTTVTAEEFRKGVQEAKTEALEESKANYVEIDPKLEVPATVSVVALREALDFLGIQEVFDTENIISLAKRLS